MSALVTGTGNYSLYLRAHAGYGLSATYHDGDFLLPKSARVTPKPVPRTPKTQPLLLKKPEETRNSTPAPPRKNETKIPEIEGGGGQKCES